MQQRPRHLKTQVALDHFKSQGEEPVIISQCLVEFRGVATRPLEVNCLGMTLAEIEVQLDILENSFRLVPDAPNLHQQWRRLCREAGVSGKQVHDTRIAAACAAAGITTILTWNPSDFRRFLPFVPGLAVMTPEEAARAI